MDQVSRTHPPNRAMTNAVLGRNIFGRRALWLAVGLLFGWALANGPAAAQDLPSPGD